MAYKSIGTSRYTLERGFTFLVRSHHTDASGDPFVAESKDSQPSR